MVAMLAIFGPKAGLILTSTRLAIDPGSASPTSRPRRATLSYPTRRQAIREARYDVIEKVRGLCLTRKHGPGEDEQQIEIQHGKSAFSFSSALSYNFHDNFYLNTIKPHIHLNRLSILFPTRLRWVLCDIVEAN